MNGIDRQQLFAALVGVVMALFVASGTPLAGRWRRELRAVTIILFLLALVAALAQIVVWLIAAPA